MYALNFIRGFCMAIADSVPGVSGGTIAFILGFYDDFVDSIHGLLSSNKENRVKAFGFLSKIGIGWVTGFILSVLFITSVFEKNIYHINSLFLGFIIASIPLIINADKEILRSNKRGIVFLAIGIFVVWAMTYFNPIRGDSSSFSIKASNLNLAFMIYIFISGMIAISAMVLPGISGSTILLIFGLYAPIMGAIKNVIKLKFEYMPSLIIFSIGVLIGVLLIVRSVRYLLRKFRAETIYCIIGLMIGSIYSVIMGPTSLENPKDAMNFDTFSIVFFIIGCMLVPSLEILKKILDRNYIDDDIDY